VGKCFFWYRPITRGVPDNGLVKQLCVCVCYSSCNLQWHQLDYMQSICTSLQTGAPHTNTPSLNFYRPNSTQFLVPNQQCQSTEGKQTYVTYPQQLQKSGLALKMLNKCACVILYSMSLEWWGYWPGYLSGARCRLACGPADTTATHCLLLQ